MLHSTILRDEPRIRFGLRVSAAFHAGFRKLRSRGGLLTGLFSVKLFPPT